MNKGGTVMLGGWGEDILVTGAILVQLKNKRMVYVNVQSEATRPAYNEEEKLY